MSTRKAGEQSGAGPIERRWEAEVVEADHVVEAIHDEDSVTSDRFTIHGFLEAAGLLVSVVCFEETLDQYVSGSASRFR